MDDSEIDAFLLSSSLVVSATYIYTWKNLSVSQRIIQRNNDEQQTKGITMYQRKSVCLRYQFFFLLLSLCRVHSGEEFASVMAKCLMYLPVYHEWPALQGNGVYFYFRIFFFFKYAAHTPAHDARIYLYIDCKGNNSGSRVFFFFGAALSGRRVAFYIGEWILNAVTLNSHNLIHFIEHEYVMKV